jgi:polysaccharide export outer membrane protein
VKAIYLLRTENGTQVKLPFNYKDVVRGKHPEQNIALEPGDTVVVP